MANSGDRSGQHHQRNFQVDLGGVVDLLSRHIYSGPRVYLRELLQNGVDAVAARREIDPTAPQEIRIRPIVADRTTFSLTDTGIGLTAEEARDLLTTVGRTSKRDEFGLQREGRLGQFGVGLLSCFMVADGITMVSRAADPAARAIHWTGFSDGTFELTELTAEQTDALPVGTTTHLTPRPDERALLSENAVVRIATEYGRYLPVDITVEGVRHTRITTDPVFVDEVDKATRLTAGRERLGRSPFDVIDLSGPDAPDVQGVAYVLPAPQAPHMTRNHSVYVHRMLVENGPTPLLPSWAFFVECEISSTRLSPTASRESLVEDAALIATREHLGNRIRSWLLDTARSTPHRLREFTAVHDLALRQLCLSDAELASTMLQFLTFETTDGRLTASEIVELVTGSGRELQISRSLDDFRQIAALTPPHPGSATPVVVNGGYVHDAELVWMFPQVFDGVQVSTADLRASLDLLDLPPLSESRRTGALERSVAEALSDHQISGAVRVFEPTDVPAVFVTDRAATASRDRNEVKGQTTEQWASILDTVDLAFGASAQPESTRPLSVLCLNWSCPLVRQLASAADAAVVSRTIRLLYVQALLAGRRPLGTRERALLTGSLSDLVALSLGPEL
ncbi:HSP90 family protein [Corynebacterium terpenotabidum]|uniref:HSP90 family protein n=1 Tax=Corynebacterium terpenotabidum Y-11 TaxID=1200352 RepID=S4XDV6_9CORY|nr:HSP90 family protein [Corynebacterium terpenotabidum]AGP30724.1 HSP90 family protein [Corynebacterium terpenotabidum Y-11]